MEDVDADDLTDEQHSAEPEERDEPAPPPSPEPLSREESRRRMLTARRRLLIMLLALEAAASALAVLQLAAPWVLIPPTVMLAGYLLLLREASKADRETARLQAEDAETRARAYAREQASSRASAPASPSRRRLATEDYMAPEATEPVEPRPEDYEDLGNGRDYAPGLIDQGEHEYRRAVGD
jgi:hypothetical protein